MSTLTLLGVNVVANPEYADAGYLSCESGEICMWNSSGYTGCFDELVRLPSTDHRYADDYGSLWNNCRTILMDDRITSYRNRSRLWMVWYTGMSYTGAKFCAAPGARSDNLGHFNNWFRGNPNDTFSGHDTLNVKPPGCNWTDTS
jgi:hypothetical protein